MADMPRERWRQVERLYNEAMDRDASHRDAFLDTACGSDAELRGELASLVHFGAAADGFLDRSALADTAGALVPDQGLPPPHQIGGYEERNLRFIRDFDCSLLQ